MHEALLYIGTVSSKTHIHYCRGQPSTSPRALFLERLGMARSGKWPSWVTQCVSVWYQSLDCRVMKITSIWHTSVTANTWSCIPPYRITVIHWGVSEFTLVNWTLNSFSTLQPVWRQMAMAACPAALPSVCITTHQAWHGPATTTHRNSVTTIQQNQILNH
jgi:hypothetical protein